MANSTTQKQSPQHEVHGLADYLIADGLLDADTAAAAVHQAALQGMTLPQYLVKMHLLSSQIILACCKKYFDLPIFDLKNYDHSNLENATFKHILCHYRVIPLQQDQTYLYLGITDPTERSILSAITFQTGMPIRTMLVEESELNKIFLLYTLTHYSELQTTSTQDSSPYEDESIIELTDKIIQQAIESKASDIHIEPYQHYCRIRFRCDGILSEICHLPLHLATPFIARLKIMANLNIAEKRLPQDGRIVWQKTTSLDIRMNICPTLFGEKLVLRLLDKTRIHLDLNEIGLFEEQKKILLTQLNQPQGIIFVTGPTGSGKTMTLYSALHYLNQIEKNIFSLEDPIEIELHGINQVTIHPKIGLDFAAALRAILRQDPDVIMIGEIRDTTTASISIQAAHTGHLVLSTLHTNSAIETIQRLQSLGVSSYHLIDSLSLLIAQRLVRKLCQHCKQADELPTTFTTYRAIGCHHCHHGYQGRIGIFELIPITHSIAQLITSGKTEQLFVVAKNEGWKLLAESGWEMVRSGITSRAEITRALGTKAIL